jgi:hypothetical protein
MTWGIGPWGAGSPWGTGSVTPPPTLIAASPTVIDELGGDVILLVGTNFIDPMLVEFMQAGVTIGASTVPGSDYADAIADDVARGIILDPRYDIEQNRAYVGTPALPVGTYDVRVTTAGGTSGVLVGAVESMVIAMEHRVLAMRAKWGRAWQVGPRLLTGG